MGEGVEQPSVAAPLCKDKGSPGGEVPALVNMVQPAFTSAALCQTLFIDVTGTQPVCFPGPPSKVGETAGQQELPLQCDDSAMSS